MQPIEIVAKIIPAAYPRTFDHIADHIKAKRLDSGLTQTEAANIIGTNDSTVLDWERGYTTDPALRLMPGIIEFLGYCPYRACPTLPEKVAIWRKTRGLSLSDVARLVGVDEGSVTKFEVGQGLSDGFRVKIAAKLQQLLMR